MKYRALESFSGKISMYKGEIRELTKEVAKDLLKANYIEKIKDNTKEDSPEEDGTNES